jgi:CheY-like chemotaxis protein
MAITDHASLAELRVLVVEDEYFIADDIARALKALGAQLVGPVPTIKAASRILLDEPRIDIAVLDINLRGETVFPFAEDLRARNVPFVFATGYDKEAIPDDFRSVPRWEKPFRPEDLAEVLHSLV